MADKSDNAGGSSSISSEHGTKKDYDEELDFLSPKFNPERALHSPDVVVPYPCIKSFQSVKSYEDTIKRRQLLSKCELKPNAADKPQEERRSDTPSIIEQVTNKSDTGSKRLSREQSRSCETSLSGSSRSNEKECSKSPRIRKHDNQTEQSSGHSTTRLPVSGERSHSATYYTSIKTRELSTHSLSTNNDTPSNTSRTTICNKPCYSLSKNNEKQLHASGEKSCKRQESTSHESIQTAEPDERPACTSSNEKSLSSALSRRPQSHSYKGHERSSSYSHVSSKSAERSYKIQESTSHESIRSNNMNERQSSASSSSYNKSTSASNNSQKHRPHSSKSQEKSSHNSRASFSSNERLTKSHTVTAQARDTNKRPAYASSSNSETTLCASSKQAQKLHQTSKDHGRSSSCSQLFSKNYEMPLKEFIKNPQKSSKSCEKLIDSMSEFFDKPSSTLSKHVDKLKQDHTSSVKEEMPSSYSISDRQESSTESCTERKNSPSSHEDEVQKSHTAETIVPATIEAPSDHEKGRSSNQKDKSSNQKGKSRIMRNIFSRMDSVTGPLYLLKRCVQERLLVRVMIRGAVTARSICRGYIVAFDKHFNMAMIDVEEIYRRPAYLGKIKSRISHKLIAAQKTLQEEKEECQAKWKGEQEITNASSSFQDLSIKPDVKNEDKLSETVSSQTIQSTEKVEIPSSKIVEPFQRKLRRIQSVYEGLKAPLSPFEREALMLGIPDENVEHRHVHQMLVRGENVVSVSIVHDF